MQFGQFDILEINKCLYEMNQVTAWQSVGPTVLWSRKEVDSVLQFSDSF